MPYADEFSVNSQIKNMSDHIKKIEDNLKQVEKISGQRITLLERRLASNIPERDLLGFKKLKKKKKKSIKRKKGKRSVKRRR